MSPNPFAQERLLFAPATPDADAIPTIFAFPNEYTVGITSLGYQIVWATLAVRSDIEVGRLFTDIHEQLPRHPEQDQNPDLRQPHFHCSIRWTGWIRWLISKNLQLRVESNLHPFFTPWLNGLCRFQS